jgi:hypothetical protein
MTNVPKGRLHPNHGETRPPSVKWAIAPSPPSSAHPDPDLVAHEIKPATPGERGGHQIATDPAAMLAPVPRGKPEPIVVEHLEDLDLHRAERGVRTTESSFSSGRR